MCVLIRDLPPRPQPIYAKSRTPPPPPILQCICKQSTYSDLWVIVMQIKDLAELRLQIKNFPAPSPRLSSPQIFSLRLCELCVKRSFLSFPSFSASKKCIIMHFSTFPPRKLHYNACSLLFITTLLNRYFPADRRNMSAHHFLHNLPHAISSRRRLHRKLRVQSLRGKLFQRRIFQSQIHHALNAR